VPVILDLFNQQLVYDAGPAGDDVARFINAQAPLMNLFPEKVAGLQRIFIAYVEGECEGVGFKVNDAFGDKWLRSDLERGLHRRHKERKFGVGCLKSSASSPSSPASSRSTPTTFLRACSGIFFSPAQRNCRPIT
jgi:hypothetical protein